MKITFEEACNRWTNAFEDHFKTSQSYNSIGRCELQQLQTTVNLYTKFEVSSFSRAKDRKVFVVTWDHQQCYVWRSMHDSYPTDTPSVAQCCTVSQISRLPMVLWANTVRWASAKVFTIFCFIQIFLQLAYPSCPACRKRDIKRVLFFQDMARYWQKNRCFS